MLVLDRFDAAEVAALHDRGEFFWLDLLDPSGEELDELAGILSLPPLAAEDTRDFGQRAKIDEYGERLLIVFFGAHREHGRAAELVEIHVHVSGNEVVTVRREPCAPLEAVRTRALHSEEDVVYRLLDALAESLLDLVRTVEEQVSDLEQRAFSHPTKAERRRISQLRTRLFRLQQVIDAERDMLASGGDVIERLPGLARDAVRHRFRDVHDTLVLSSNLVAYCRELLAETLNVYLQITSNRLNEIATRLTLLATIFLPLTLVTSFFGQNFGWLVGHIGSLESFLIWGVGGIVLPAAAILAWLHRAGYLRGDGQ